MPTAPSQFGSEPCPGAPFALRRSQQIPFSAVWTISTQKPLPRQAPALKEIVAHVAGLGGWLGRKHDDPPGPKSIWIGLQRTKDFALAWSTFGPKGSETCV